MRIPCRPHPFGRTLSRGPRIGSRLPAAPCPKASDITTGPATLNGALRASRRLVGQAFTATLPENSWARYPEIVAALSLEPQNPQLPGAGIWRRLGERRCGRAVTLRSWVVVMNFPRSKVARSNVVAFVAQTHSGWRLWYLR